MSRRDDLQRFYCARSPALRRAVAAAVRTGDSTVLEDACQHAWLMLVRRPDVPLDDRGATWLRTTAIREGWRLARPGREVPSGAFGEIAANPLEHPEVASLYGDPEAIAIARGEHDARAADIRQLPAGHRRVLLLHAAGYRYREIAALTELKLGSLNRQLVTSRRQLRQRQAEREIRERRT